MAVAASPTVAGGGGRSGVKKRLRRISSSEAEFAWRVAARGSDRSTSLIFLCSCVELVVLCLLLLFKFMRCSQRGPEERPAIST
jgi:hypothetical protein